MLFCVVTLADANFGIARAAMSLIELASAIPAERSLHGYQGASHFMASRHPVAPILRRIKASKPR
jgi:hypothetical protein